MTLGIAAISLGAAVDEHVTWLAAHNYAATTIANRSRYLDAFTTFLTERDVLELAEVRLAHLEAYQHHLYQARKADGAPLSFRTQAQRLIPVKVFFGWATRRGLLTADPAVLLELPRAERRLPDATLTAVEAETVMALPDISTVLGLRDRAILEVFWATGIRRAELAHVLVHHVDRARATLFVRHGKGARDRYVPLGARAAGWVDAYLTHARPHLVAHPDAGVLFVSATGRPLALDWLSRTVRAYIHAGTGKPGSCHLLRHTAATGMLEGGADIRYVAELLGHARLETTQIYTRVSIDKLTEVHARTHPSARQA